ncbi:MAG: ankyrin repeat domain-containing protein [Nitrospinae bacterium]|nr:ankyrin repeat domain-containing protein [Nitrospinota bacterium]
MLRNGADPNARNTDGVTPLHEAALSATLGVVSALVQAGACPNAEDKNGWTPLYVAARFSTTIRVVTSLLQAGADPRAQDKNDWTPLHRAARDENDETPWDHVRMDSPLRGTDVFWRLKDERRP